MMTYPHNKLLKLFPRQHSYATWGYHWEFIFKYQQQEDTLSTPQQDHESLTQSSQKLCKPTRCSQGLIDDEQLERVAQMISQNIVTLEAFGLVHARWVTFSWIGRGLWSLSGCWATSIIDEKCLVFVFPLQELSCALSSIVCGVTHMGVRPFSLNSQRYQAFLTETVAVETGLLYPTNLCSIANAHFNYLLILFLRNWSRTKKNL